MGQVGNLLVVGLTTIASGLLDARGFVYAGRAWPGGQLDVKFGLLSLTCFGGGLSSADYAHLPNAAFWVLSAGMIVGRLEVIMAVVLFLPGYWRR